jgi:hypothetical protein
MQLLMGAVRSQKSALVTLILKHGCIEFLSWSHSGSSDWESLAQPLNFTFTKFPVMLANPFLRFSHLFN